MWLFMDAQETAGISPAIPGYAEVNLAPHPDSRLGWLEVSLETEGGEKALRREGHRGGIWVLLDYGSVVIHVFNDEAREFYALERLWNDGKSVDLTKTFFV